MHGCLETVVGSSLHLNLGFVQGDCLPQSRSRNSFMAVSNRLQKQIQDDLPQKMKQKFSKDTKDSDILRKEIYIFPWSIIFGTLFVLNFQGLPAMRD